MLLRKIGPFFGLLLIVYAAVVCGQQPSTANVNSAVPPLVSFGGVLTDINGKAMTGPVGVTFALYKESQGGSSLWLETQNVYPDKTGRYTVLLGSTTSTGLPSDLFVSGEARWLGVQVQGQPEQARVSLLSVPYALKAGDAQTVGGLPPSAFVLAAPPASTNTPSRTNNVISPLATGSTPVTTAGGTINVLAKWDAAADITNSQIFDTGTNVGIGTSAPAAKLDVKGTLAVRGLLALPAIGTATATTGYTSQPLKMSASAFNSGTGTAVGQNFQFQAEPVGNNTSGATGSLNFLYSTGTNKLAETGLRIAPNGQITFAAGQTFPGTGSGNGSVTSVALTAPSTDFIVTGSPVTSSGTLGLGWITAPDFNNTPNAIVKRDSNGNFSAGAINAANSFQLGGYVFGQGNYASLNAFLGFAGNSTTSGSMNTASGYDALAANTNGSSNTASGAYALVANTSGTANTAIGSSALSANTTGSVNTASGTNALPNNTTGSSNTASGDQALYSNNTGNLNTGVGMDSLFSNTSGSNNSGLGMNALYYNSTGSSNTALGYASGPDKNSTNLSNATAIGANAVVSASNALVLGCINGVNNCPAPVNIGIGTATPSFTLDVQGNGRFTQPVTFASNQTFPGSGTITGVTAGSGLSGGGTSGNVTLANTGVLSVTAGTDLTGGGSGGTVKLNLDTTKVPQLATANTFSAAQTFNGGISITSTGFYGLNATGGSIAALYGASVASGSYGVYGSGTAAGVTGDSQGYGLYGLGNIGAYAEGSSYGAYAQADSSTGTGVYGVSTSGTGVSGYGTTGVYGVSNSTSGYGVYGTTPINTSGAGIRGQEGSRSQVSVSWGGSGVWGDGGAPNNGYSEAGVIATTDNNNALVAVNNSQYPTVNVQNWSATGDVFSAWGGSGWCKIDGSGTLSCTGSKNAVVPIDGGRRKVALSAIESPQNWFEDFGSAQLSNGSAVVAIDPEYAQTVNTGVKYHVFLTPNGECNGLYISRRTPTSFEVRELGRGTSSVEFSYRIVALRKNYESIRLADHTNDPDPIKLSQTATPYAFDSSKIGPPEQHAHAMDPATRGSKAAK